MAFQLDMCRRLDKVEVVEEMVVGCLGKHRQRRMPKGRDRLMPLMMYGRCGIYYIMGNGESSVDLYSEFVDLDLFFEVFRMPPRNYLH